MQFSILYKNMIICKMRKQGFIIMLLMCAVYCKAAYMENVPTRLVQPNGEVINCFITGDEYYRYVYDSLGYSIVKNPVTGYYVYALPQADSVTYSNYVVGQVSPHTLGIPQHVRWSAQKIMTKRKEYDEKYGMGVKTRKAIASTNKGVLNNLVIFVSFADDTNFTYTTYPTELQKFNDSSSATAVSVYNFYRTVSYGQFYMRSHLFPIQNDTAVISYHDIYDRAYYSPYDGINNPQGYTSYSERTTREHMLLHRAVEAIKSQIPSSLNLDYDNDGKVDNVAFIFNGHTDAWNDLLWPHRWTLYTKGAETYINGLRVYDYNFLIENDNTVGVITHELFHSLGAPDLYHYSDATITPVGRWDLMASTNRGKPQGMGAYMKYKYGKWVSAPITLTQPGTYTLYPANGSSPDKIAYQIPIPMSTEYILLEYRRAITTSFDSPLNGSGIVAYRINPAYNGNANYDGSSVYDEVYVYRPGGTVNTDGTLSTAHFSAETGRTTFSSQTNPYMFFSSGVTINGITICNITSAGDSIQFTYLTSTVTVDADKENVSLAYAAGSNDIVKITASGNWEIRNADTSWLTFSPMSGGSGSTYVSITAKENNYIHKERTSSITVATISNSVNIGIKQSVMPMTSCDAYTNMASTDMLQHETLPEDVVAAGEYFYLSDTMVSDSMRLYIGNMPAVDDNSYVKVEICNANNNQKPASVLRTLMVPASQLTPKAWNTLHFDIPLLFTKSFTIACYLYMCGEAEGKALELVTADHSGKIDVNGTLLQKIGNGWKTLSEQSLNNKRTASMPIEMYMCPVTSSDNYMNVNTAMLTMSSMTGDTAEIAISSNMDWQVCRKPEWLNVSAMTGHGNATLELSTIMPNNMGKQKDTLCLRAESYVHIITITRNPLAVYVDKSPVVLEYEANSNDSFKVIASSKTEWQIGTSRYFILSVENTGGTQMVQVYAKRDNNTGKEISEKVYLYTDTDTNFVLIKQKSGELGINESASHACKVYPNPASDYVYIESAAEEIIERVDLYNMLGQRIAVSCNADAAKACLHVQGIAKGMYVIRISTAHNVYNQCISIK